MFHCSIIEAKQSASHQAAPKLTITLLAELKYLNEHRIFSWTRVQNDLLPDIPYTSLPDPSLFDKIALLDGHGSSIYLDVADMFHNIFL